MAFWASLKIVSKSNPMITNFVSSANPNGSVPVLSKDYNRGSYGTFQASDGEAQPP